VNLLYKDQYCAFIVGKIVGFVNGGENEEGLVDGVDSNKSMPLLTMSYST